MNEDWSPDGINMTEVLYSCRILSLSGIRHSAQVSRLHLHLTMIRLLFMLKDPEGSGISCIEESIFGT